MSIFACRRGKFRFLSLSAGLLFCVTGRGADSSGGVLVSPRESIWAANPGEGFSRGTEELALNIGPGFGLRVFGGKKSHDWCLATIEYGRVTSGVQGAERWYRGNWEIIGEAFGAGQYHPDAAYAAGIAPLVRYDFALGQGWVLFLNAGAGLASTSIRNSELSTTFEFNVQGGLGLHYFVSDSVAITAQFRFMHISNASTHFPNVGVNTGSILAGVTWVF